MSCIAFLSSATVVPEADIKEQSGKYEVHIREDPAEASAAGGGAAGVDPENEFSAYDSVRSQIGANPDACTGGSQ